MPSREVTFSWTIKKLRLYTRDTRWHCSSTLPTGCTSPPPKGSNIAVVCFMTSAFRILWSLDKDRTLQQASVLSLAITFTPLIRRVIMGSMCLQDNSDKECMLTLSPSIVGSTASLGRGIALGVKWEGSDCSRWTDCFVSTLFPCKRQQRMKLFLRLQ